MIVTILGEDGASRDVEFGDGPCRIGRSRDCQVFVTDPLLSRFHAEIYRDGEQWLVVDRGSRNGTFVNQEKIDHPTPVEAGDRISVGRTTLVFGPPPARSLSVSDADRPETRTLGSLRVQEAPLTALTRILVDAARAITSHRPAQEVLQQLLELARRATRAERGMIARREPSNLLAPVVFSPPKASPPVISRRVLERVLEGGEALSLEDLPDELASRGTIMGAGIRSILCAPLGLERPFAGVFYLDSLVGRADFQPQHLEVVAILAGMADVVLDQERMRAERERLRRVESELRAAAEIETALLPPEDPAMPAGFAAAGFHRACQTIGGDLYDFYQCGGNVGVMLADVAGKGLPAALLMANLHARWHGVRLAADAPGTWMGRLNEEFQKAHPGNRFVTMAFGQVNAERNELLFASAGHNPALLLNGDRFEWLSSTGPVLGIIPNQDFELLVRPFPPGSRLVIYSDGVTDQRNARGDSFGPERLLRAVQNAEGKPPRGLIEAVRDELEFFAGDAPQDDDTTIAVLARD